MNMSVLLEPIATGFKATSLTVADLQAEDATEAGALQAIRRKLDDRIGIHGKIVQLPMDDDAEFLLAWEQLRQSKSWPEFDEILREQRAKSDAQDELDYGAD